MYWKYLTLICIDSNKTVALFWELPNVKNQCENKKNPVIESVKFSSI
jgi:hypothetical protein